MKGSTPTLGLGNWDSKFESNFFQEKFGLPTDKHPKQGLPNVGHCVIMAPSITAIGQKAKEKSMQSEVMNLSKLLFLVSQHLTQVNNGEWPDDEYGIDGAVHTTLEVLYKVCTELHARQHEGEDGFTYDMSPSEALSEFERLILIFGSEE